MIRILITTVVFWISMPVFANDLPKPEDFMRSITNHVIEGLKTIDTESHEMLLQLIQSDIMPHVDSTFMAKWVVGRSAWIKSSPRQQEEFITSFASLLVDSYANTLVLFKDREIDFKEPKKPRHHGKTTQVTCIIKQRGLEPITILFQLRASDGQWKIFDVVLEGISLLKGLKVQFSDDIDSYGLVGVSERIKKKSYKLDEVAE